MQVDVKSVQGSKKNVVTLHESVFDVDVSQGSVYYGIKNELANKRQGTAKTKGRAEVLYSGRKPWKQKGTGRARAGTRRSPIWVGGGTIFGPQPRDYSYVLPKKIKRLAFRSVLTEKLKEGILDVVENFSIDSGKTKECVEVLKSVNPDQSRTVLIVTDSDANIMIKRAARNISWVRVYSYSRLLLKDLFYAKKILIMEDAVEQLNVFLSDTKGNEV